MEDPDHAAEQLNTWVAEFKPNLPSFTRRDDHLAIVINIQFTNRHAIVGLDGE